MSLKGVRFQIVKRGKLQLVLSSIPFTFNSHRYTSLDLMRGAHNWPINRGIYTTRGRSTRSTAIGGEEEEDARHKTRVQAAYMLWRGEWYIVHCGGLNGTEAGRPCPLPADIGSTLCGWGVPGPPTGPLYFCPVPAKIKSYGWLLPISRVKTLHPPPQFNSHTTVYKIVNCILSRVASTPQLVCRSSIHLFLSLSLLSLSLSPCSPLLSHHPLLSLK